MNLEEALTLPQRENIVNIDSFLRLGHSMPPLDKSAVTLEGLYRNQRCNITTLTNGDGSFLLRYKNKEGAVLSLKENNKGEVWIVTQVQGANSRKSFRLCSGLDWSGYLASVVREIGERVETTVRQIQMPKISEIDGVCDARSELVNSTYEKVMSVLGLRFSKENGIFIRDFKKSVWA